MSTSFPLDDHRWLVSEQAVPWLDEANAWPAASVALASKLRKTLSATRVHLVMEQVELRRRAKEKFAAAERMFFTPRGLEQATDEMTASYKAGRMPSGCVADLCCGIGGDLLSLARRGPVVAVDRDPVATLLAEANCHACAGWSPAFRLSEGRLKPGLQLYVGDVLTAPLEDCTAAHLDPDRRPSGRRTTQLQWHEPGPEQIEQLLRRVPNLALKLAPAAAPPDDRRELAEWEWISRGGQCRQLVAWFGSLAQAAGSRRATIVGPDRTARRTFEGIPGLAAPACQKIGRFLHEPDAAVLAAGLEGALAAEHGLEAISPGIAYLTGDATVADAALSTFEIEEIVSFDLKTMRALLAQRGIGRLEIKKRGVEVDPAKLRKQLALRGDNEAVLILTPCRGKTTAILARRVTIN